MKRSDLINALAKEFHQLPHQDVELAVHCMLEQMIETMATGQRIEIRDFGSFTLHYCPARQGRNPKTGEKVALKGSYRPHFKPGKALRERVNLRPL